MSQEIEQEPEDISHLDDIMSELFSSSEDVNYPKEAMLPGTFARSTRLDRLGVITDAFYAETDTRGENIIVYSLLLFPKTTSFSNYTAEDFQYYISNEYEYETIGYLMMSRVDLNILKQIIGQKAIR